MEAAVHWPPDLPHLSWLYVGLFPVRAARGRPVAGSLLRRGDPFVLVDVPPGEHWLLASAFGSQDAYAQLVPDDLVTGGAPGPLTVRRGAITRASLRLARPQHWETPITVALPAPTSPGDPAPQRPLRRLPTPVGLAS